MKADPNFRPPVEYHQQKRSNRPSDKVYIPVKEFPQVNSLLSFHIVLFLISCLYPDQLFW
jgi:hypothetical protein